MASGLGASAATTTPAVGVEVKGGGGASSSNNSSTSTSSARLKGTGEPPGRRLLSSKSLNLSFAQRKHAKQKQNQDKITEEQKQQPPEQHQQQASTYKTQQKQQQKQQQTATKTQKGSHKKQSNMVSARPQSTNLVDGDYRMLRDIDRPPPGDPSTRNRASQGQVDMAKRRSTYFEDQFASTKKEKNAVASSLSERVRSEAIVMAEVKTNVILSDEFTFITELSYNLSLRFQRPVSSIVVSIQHGTCMMFGGTFEPAYTMTILALPSQVQPTTNKRNAVLIQSHMEEVLGVAPARGLLRFVPMPEENVAVNGKTILTEITELAKEAGVELIDDEESSANKRRSRMLRNRLSVRVSRRCHASANPSLYFLTSSGNVC
ncbi:MIF domain-containing protein [Magnaporthiopsis poae ATCC 64411]|uniref:L-dopachrome isomerase n=1 Tax=Magnaporthiopsis poae (strain ATCC 64411 / 73-15) TaxID=644358 RepID=A0A0C4E2H3_MAGP6|nr:MIF domain-containing protein [Magnaporthiopsis poae ATCC 64411]